MLGQPDNQGSACGLDRQDSVLEVRAYQCRLSHLGTVPAASFLSQPASRVGPARRMPSVLWQPLKRSRGAFFE